MAIYYAVRGFGESFISQPREIRLRRILQVYGRKKQLVQLIVSG